MKATLHWAGIAVGVVAGLLILGILVLYSAGRMRLNKKYEVPPEMIAIPNDAESLNEGKRIFQYRGCEACHGEQLQGLIYLDNPAIGQVITPNLTSGQGGIGAQRTDKDLIRAIKHGIRPGWDAAVVHAIHRVLLPKQYRSGESTCLYPQSTTCKK